MSGSRSEAFVFIRRLIVLATLLSSTMLCVTAEGRFHTYQIEQVYSNADGTVQFIVLHESQDSNSENLFLGHFIRGQDNYVFADNLPSEQTASTHVLIATKSFAALNLITPDYIVPDKFLSVTNGDVNFADVDEIAYAALPTDGVMALGRDGKPVQNVAKNFAGQSASVGKSDINYEGLWWNAPAGSESGWGINFAHQGDIIFATWFTYDASGKAWWLSMTATKTATNTYAGTLYQTTGPAFNAVPFDPTKVQATSVGNATLTFTDQNNGQFAYSVNGVSQMKTITRQVFSTMPTCEYASAKDMTQATNYQDLWWNVPAGSESGWGVNLTHQGDIIFATWFTYGVDGKPMWLSVSANKSAPATYTGTLYRTTGPAFNAVPFDPAKVDLKPVGNVTLTFANGNSGSFAYSVDGVQQTKTITRQVFRAPGTLCQ